MKMLQNLKLSNHGRVEFFSSDMHQGTSPKGDMDSGT